MKLKTVACILTAALLALGTPSCNATADRETLTQISTINALMAGAYDGVTTAAEVKKYGDFGIGTFTALDGEMVELDGRIYQIKADGDAYAVPDAAGMPFAAVTYFDTDRSLSLPADMDYASLQQYIDGLLPTENIFYAFKITGNFSYMKTRSVPAQSKPYPHLVEATANQAIFEFYNIEGTLVGFRCPSYVNGVNVPGYHLHFLTSDKDGGGHVLDFRVMNATAEIDYTSEFRMILPGEGSEFYGLNFTTASSGDLEKAER